MDKESRTNCVDVVAALILDAEGRFLICRRPPHKARGDLWEFVGGKVEVGESREDALIRECREELDITITVGELYMELTHCYPDLTVHLFLYRATVSGGTPKLLEHTALCWICPEEICHYDFCPADTEILQKIIADRKTE